MNIENVPRLIFWELTKRCNLTCQHCRAEAHDIEYSGCLLYTSEAETVLTKD